MDHAIVIGDFPARQNLARVQDDTDEVVVPPKRVAQPADGRQVHQWQASLRGDSERHGVGHLHAIGAVKLLVAEKRRGKFAQPALCVRGQPVQERECRQCGLPEVFRKRRRWCSR